MAAEHLALVETLTSLASVRKSWSGATQGGDFNHGGIGANRSRNLYERQAKRERASTPVRDTELINQRGRHSGCHACVLAALREQTPDLPDEQMVHQPHGAQPGNQTSRNTADGECNRNMR
jgi:hypothetical protein